jgi:hypothetical protein
MTEPLELAPPAVELTGEEICFDAASRLVEALGRNCNLTSLCSYRGYHGKIVAELQLEDVDTVAVKTTVTAGSFDPAKPSQRVEVEIATAEPASVRQRSGLTKPRLERFELAEPLAPKKKFHATAKKPAA